jgi:hypothetical protein
MATAARSQRAARGPTRRLATVSSTVARLAGRGMLERVDLPGGGAGSGRGVRARQRVARQLVGYRSVALERDGRCDGCSQRQARRFARRNYLPSVRHTSTACRRGERFADRDPRPSRAEAGWAPEHPSLRPPSMRDGSAGVRPQDTNPDQNKTKGVHSFTRAGSHPSRLRASELHLSRQPDWRQARRPVACERSLAPLTSAGGRDRMRTAHP